MTIKKRFIYGLLSQILLIILNSLLVIFNNKSFSFSWIFISIIIYFVISLGIIIWEKMIKEPLLFIFKIIAIIFVSVILFTNFSFLSQEVLFTLPLLVAFLWSIPDINESEQLIKNKSGINTPKQTEEELPETKSNNIFPYLINFIILFIIYVIASMCYYNMETGERIWSVILIMGLGLTFVYWLSYLYYKYLLKNTKTTRIIKIAMILALLYWMYYFCSTIKETPFHLLISVTIAAFISLTIQNLILTKGNK